MGEIRAGTGILIMKSRCGAVAEWITRWVISLDVTTLISIIEMNNLLRL